MDSLVEIFTDGACRGNPGPGGWAALVCCDGEQSIVKGNAAETTNNRMELSAAIYGLAALKKSCRVIVTTDSTYVRNGITLWIKRWEKNDWRTAQNKPVKNKDLWLGLLAEIKRHRIQWQWVRGHSGHVENEHVDALARQAMQEIL